MLKIASISKSFNGKQVISDISFEINKGEIVSIIGPSGAGKTTILRCINGLESIDQGSIEICGMKLCHVVGNQCIYPSPKKLRSIRINIGMVFQGYNLFPHLSVLENIIEAPVNAYGVSKKAAEAKAFDLLDMLELTEKANSYPFELSGGEKQRVAIARALQLDPRLMCFDEPTSALDPELTEGVAAIIEKLAQKGISILIITHDMAFAKRISHRLIFIENGKILKKGVKEEFFGASIDERINKFITQYA